MTDYATLARRPLALALAAAIMLPLSAFAQNAQNTDEKDDDSAELDKITVVGSRIKRSEIEGPAPVTVISREDIDKEGFQTVSDVLQSLTQNTSNSFTGELAVTGFTPNASVVNLRNFGPGYTLTLINGRRLPDYPQPYNRDGAAVNVNAIPTSIIERIEVLSGGASAIYGSDAVAGVVNIVLRTNYEGNFARTTVGTTTAGGGDSWDTELSGGRVGDTWSFTYALQYRYEEPVFASQRDFLDDLRDGPNGANVAPSLSLIAIDLSTGANRNRAAYYPGEEVCNRFGHSSFVSATRGLICGSYNSVASRSISNKRENASAYFYGDLELSDAVEGWVSGTLYDSTATAGGGTEFWGTSGDPFLRTRTGAVTSAYFDQGLNRLVQLQRILTPAEVGGNNAVTTTFDEKSFEIAAGVRGTIFDRFDWDATIARAEYDYETDRPRLLAQAVHNLFLGPLLGYTSNGTPIYTLQYDAWHSPLTPDQYRAVSTRVINESETTATQANLIVSGDLFDLPAGAVGFAGTLEAAEQTLDLFSDPRTDPLRTPDAATPYNLRSSGATEGERRRYAIGAEFHVPVLDVLSLTGAARYDKYDDITEVDDAVTYNFGIEYRPVDSLLLRGAYATSFRSPDMQLVFAQGSAAFTSALDQYACRSAGRTLAQCNVSGDTTIYSMQNSVSGNPLLKEEEGESYTAGFVWDALDDLSLTVDYFDIKLEDAASVQSLATILEAEANCRLGTYPNGDPYPNPVDSAFCRNIISLVTRQSAPGTALDGRVANVSTSAINTAIQRTTGVDASLKYQYDTDDWGSFAFDFGYSLMLKEEYAENVDDPVIDYTGDLSNDNQRSRVRGSVAWEKGDWSAAVFGQRLGSAPNFAETARLQPFMTYNMTIRKQITESLAARFAVNNVLNNTLREDATNTGYPFFNPFIGADPYGRSIYGSVEYKF